MVGNIPKSLAQVNCFICSLNYLSTNTLLLLDIPHLTTQQHEALHIFNEVSHSFIPYHNFLPCIPQVASCRNPSFRLTTKARCGKVANQVGDPGVMLPGVQRVWRHEHSHSQVTSHVGSWSLEWTPESSKRNFRGQNSLPWNVLYIIGKLLKLRCLKWARIAHLDIWNTSCGQKKAGSQIDNLTPDH